MMEPILKEGKNCWRIRKATRVAFLVDGAAYFDAFARSAARAHVSILIAGWDIDSRIRLFPEEERDGMPSRLWEFMNRVVKKQRNLHVHILEWDFAVIYSFERELFPVFKIPWKRNRRIHFQLDGEHPVGGSHHQKIVVMDDRIAFAGGIDLTKRRWDTPEHAASDPRRVDPSGKSYGPFHDIQIAVDGDAAAALESCGEKRVEKGIRDFHNRLLGEHLGEGARKVGELVEEERSLIKTIEKLRGSKRTLIPFPEEEIPWTTELISELPVDPTEPIDPEKLMEELVSEDGVKKSKYRFIRFIALLLGLVAIAAAWRWTPLGEWIDWGTLTALGARVRDNGAAPFIVLCTYLVGSLVMIPVTLMIVVTAFTFGPVSGFVYSLSGCLLAAIATYGLGRALGRDTIARLSGSRVNRLSRRLGRHGIITIGTVRILPIAPFTVVNLVAGASHIRFWDYVFGTILGMGPGIAAITLFENQLEAAIREPGMGSFAILACLTAAIIAAGFIIKSRLVGNHKG